MESKEHGLFIFVRLFPNENIYEKLKRACELYNVQTATIVSGLGQLKEFTLGYFKEKGDYMPETISEPYELCSLTGSVSNLENGYEFHLHATLSGPDKKVVGGHLIDGTVEVCNEIIMMKSPIEIKRKTEESTGLRGLFLD